MKTVVMYICCSPRRNACALPIKGVNVWNWRQKQSFFWLFDKVTMWLGVFWNKNYVFENKNMLAQICYHLVSKHNFSRRYVVQNNRVCFNFIASRPKVQLNYMQRCPHTNNTACTQTSLCILPLQIYNLWVKVVTRQFFFLPCKSYKPK